jgi:hypothetical protein
MTGRMRLYAGHASSPEMLRACDLILDTFHRLPEPTPERYFQLLSLLLANIIGGQINWDCVERRDWAITELFQKLERDLLQLTDPNAGVQGHA